MTPGPDCQTDQVFNQSDWNIRSRPTESMEAVALWKQAYSNIFKILPPKNEKFQIKILIFFIFLFKT